MQIFSYILAFDTGVAPCIDNNIFTLGICKPTIRRCANIGDYIIAFYPKCKNNTIAYICKITNIFNYKDYYINHNNRLDCIYDENLNLIPNKFHSNCNTQTDLNGKNVLLSFDFIFFGNLNIKISNNYKSMIPDRQGHLSKKNKIHHDTFPEYFENLKKIHKTGKIGNHMC